MSKVLRAVPGTQQVFHKRELLLLLSLLLFPWDVAKEWAA